MSVSRIMCMPVLEGAILPTSKDCDVAITIMKVADSSLLSEAYYEDKAETIAEPSKISLCKSIQPKLIAVYYAYLKIQIYNRGAYSIKRLHDLEQYCSAASNWRVLWYCLLATLSGLILETTVELVPLRSPLDPWDEQYVFWIRSYFSLVLTSFSFAYQILPFVPNVQIHLGKTFLFAITTALLVLGSNMFLAAYWTFPVPFTTVTCSVPFVLVNTSFFFVLLRKVGFDGSPHQERALKTQLNVSSLHIWMVLLYNGYNAIFQLLSKTQQVLFIGVLPLLKFGLKNIYALAMSSQEESIPELTTFNVEVFHALFVSICMQTAKSMWASIIVIGVDAIQALLSILEMESDSKTLLQALAQYNASNSSKGDLVSSVIELCQIPSVREQVESLVARENGQSIFFKRTVEPEQFRIEELIDGTCGSDSNGKPNATAKPKTRKKISEIKVIQAKDKSSMFESNTNIMPLAPIADKGLNLQERPQSEPEEVKLVYEALKLLYHAEYCMMTELVEVAIPIVYVVHTWVLYHLPNALYYPHTRNMSFEGLKIGSIDILLYALMEAATLLAFQYMLKKRFRFSAMQLLGYSLETQWRQITARSIASIWFILQFTLMHCGVDFNFKFNWAEQLGVDRDEEN